ncbi:hypothetical protein SLS62_009297 [Diatrype stigma]|uniref:Mitogen-activated protein kinase-binding protein 1 n=1 Tax=Diatrype stigma TaxID=117547 RepID=A0AAN9UID9_9PEZI
MATTPSNRLKLTPSNSPFPQRPPRSPLRAKGLPDPHLSLKRVIGTTCASPNGFDAAQSSFAYIAGGAVVVVDVNGDEYSQRFYRARPTAIPVYGASAPSHSPSASSATPKANDSRNRVSLRESAIGPLGSSDSPSSKTWTSRERIKAATCVALSREGRFLAVGETGYAPRVLIFGLEESSSDIPLVSISEHGFGVKAVAWSADTKYLASLGSSNDGCLYVWKIDPRTGAAKLFQQNRCTANVRSMIWVGNSLVTLGVRHIKVWRVEEAPRPTSPSKQKLTVEMSSPASQQKSLPGRNVLLGNMIETTFTCAVAIDETRAVICSETGDVCLFDDTSKHMKLTKVLESGFATTCVAISGNSIYLGGKSGSVNTLDLAAFMKESSDCIQGISETQWGLVGLGFLKERMVTVDVKQSINISSPSPDSCALDSPPSPIPIAGHGEPILGVEVLPQPNSSGAVFCTWTGSGRVILWDIDGKITSSFDVPLDQAPSDSEAVAINQLTIVRVTKGGTHFVTGDKLGILKIIGFPTKECISSLKVHSSDCQSITTYEDESRFLIASCGRDRTAQLIRRKAEGEFEHFQTLEFAAKVAQVLIPSPDKVITCSSDKSIQFHDLVTKDGDPDAMAALISKGLALKASPVSMTITPDGKGVLVSSLDRCVSIYDIESGKLSNTFKCTDENGQESVVLDSLIAHSTADKEASFLLGISNTDKSIRIYNAQTGDFLDREWGHTEGINGAALIEDEGTRKVVSVGTDGTIMVWEMDLQDQSWSSSAREPSPDKDNSILGRPPLRRVLSKAELAEFQQRSSATSGGRSPTAGRRSPPRTLFKKRSQYNLNTTPSARTPTAAGQSSPASVIAEDTPSRRPSSDSRSGSPPPSPKSRVTRRPSLPALGSKKKSSNNLRGLGSLNTATEQAARTLRAYRKRLTSSDSISQDSLAELDQELRLTAVALGDRAIRSKAMSDSILNGLLDQYSERLVNLLDEKLKLSYPSLADREPDSPTRSSHSSGAESSSS